MKPASRARRHTRADRIFHGMYYRKILVEKSIKVLQLLHQLLQESLRLLNLLLELLRSCLRRKTIKRYLEIKNCNLELCLPVGRLWIMDV